MYVKTQFETMINLTKFQRIKFESYDKQPSGTVFHTISAVSEERSDPIAVPGTSTKTSKFATLAAFPEDMKREAEWAYNSLFTALSEGKPTFDMTEYFPSAPSHADSTEDTEGTRV